MWVIAIARLARPGPMCSKYPLGLSPEGPLWSIPEASIAIWFQRSTQLAGSSVTIGSTGDPSSPHPAENATIHPRRKADANLLHCTERKRGRSGHPERFIGSSELSMNELPCPTVERIG